MTTSQPSEAVNPEAAGVPPTGEGTSATSSAGAVRVTALIGAVLALGTYLCGFFGLYELSYAIILVLSGGVLALLGLLPRVNRTLVPATVLSATGFFLLLLVATSPASVAASGPVKWIALALGLLSAAGVTAALLFDVGVLTPPAPRPAPAPVPPGGWNQYGGPQGQPGYQAPGYQAGYPQPGAAPGQPGLFEQGYGAQGGYGGYGTPGYGAQPGQPAQPGQAGQPGQAYGTGYPAQGYGGQAAGAQPAYGTAEGYGGQGYGAQGYAAPSYGSQPAYGTGATGYPGSSTPTVAGAGAPTSSYGTGPVGDQGSLGDSQTTATGSVSGPTLGPGAESAESTTPGVPAGTVDDETDIPDDRTRSFRPADGGPTS